MLSLRQSVLLLAVSLFSNLAVITTVLASTPTVSQALNASTGGFSCNDLRKAVQKIPVHISNIANVNTTRTPEGGPYKRVDLICKELYCESIAKEDFKLVRDPAHPDANAAGYVRFPRIDIATEFAALTSAAAEVKLLASTGLCGSTALQSATTTLVKYEKTSNIQSDSFNFNTDGRLVSWSRTLNDGTSQHVAFNSDGSVNKAQ